MGTQERRKQPRYRVKCSATLIHDGQSVSVQVLDINTRGASFLMPPFFEDIKSVILECEADQVTASFRGECCDRMVFKAKNGISLARIGVKFTGIPDNAREFFAALSSKIIREDAPTQITPERVATNPTKVMTDNESDFPTQLIDETKENKRRHKRVSMQLPLILSGLEEQYKGQSIDFSEVGIGFLTTMDFPNTDEITLHCKVKSDLVFKLRIQIRFRTEYRSGEKVFQKCGAEIKEASPEFQQFLKEQGITQKRTRKNTHTGDQHGQRKKVLTQCRYKFIEMLGAGGFAKVFLVEDVALHRKVAMKILLPKISRDRQMTRKFIKEAQISAKFHHPNIAIVYEVGEIFTDQYPSLLDFPEDVLAEFNEGMVYFTMMYIEGRTLADVIKKQRTLPPLKVLNILREVGKALEFSHREGVIHRDIKPENIMLTFDDKILVTDFGIASVLKKNLSGDIPGTDDQTPEKTKGFMGTPIYVSPEQILEEEVDARSDLYSLGITGYELLTGVPPFKGETWMETLAKQLHEQPKSLLEVNADIPSNFNDYILKLLAKKREKRPKDATVFLKNLDKLEGHLLSERVVIDEMEEVSEEMFEHVVTLFRQFTKTFKNIGTYPETHEMVTKSVDRLNRFFSTFFETYERLDLEISSMEVLFDHVSVFSEDQKENGFCFNLFRDGIRNLIFFRGMPVEELQTFLVSIYHYINNLRNYEMDSVTLLFQLELKYIDFEYSDSFYEDPDTQSRMYKIQKAITQEEKWSVPALMESAFPGHKIVVYWENIRKAFQDANCQGFVEKLRNPELTDIRTEAIRICLQLAEREQEAKIFDVQYRLMEEVIYSCISENDLTSTIYLIKTLESWGLNAPPGDSKECASRFVGLQERLSNADFIQPLVEKYFVISRGFGDGIKVICQALQPDKAVPVLFSLFLKESESWKQSFIAECCVSAAGPNTGKLNQLAMELDDELATVFLKAYRYLHPNAPKTTLMKWVSYPGVETRMVLVSLANLVNRKESNPILKRCALEKSRRFEESRKLAWQYLVKNEPKILSSVIREYFSIDALKELSTTEKKLVFQYAATNLLNEGGEAFLVEVVCEKGLLGTGSLSLEEKQIAAVQLKRTGTENSRKVLIKESKRLIGNRDFIQYCKRLSEDLT